MSDIKCPVCNKQMKIGTLDTDDSMGTVWMSIMPCDCVCSYGASKAVWQELIRTRKALDVAKYALKNIQEDMKERKDGDDIWEIQKNLHDYCKTTIKQITALEQKD